MTLLSRSIKVFSIILGLLLIALLAFVVTFDVENYRPQIIAQVEKTTGREFSIDGDIGLSIFPWVGLKVEDVALGNAAGFTAARFATIEQLDIRVNLLPLLKRDVQVNKIRLHGLNLSLEVAADGSNNWSDLAGDSQAPDKTAARAETTEQPSRPAEQTAEQVAGQPALQALYVQGLELVDAQIQYADNSSNTHAKVSAINLTTGEIQFDRPVDIAFSARVENSQPRLDTTLDLATELSFNREFTSFSLGGLALDVLMKANEFLPQDEKLVIKSDIDISMEDQLVTVKQLRLSALDTVTSADVSISQFQQDPLINGTIAVQTFNAVRVAGRAGVELPPMARDDALHRVAVTTNIFMQGEKLEANNFRMQLDDSSLSGWLHLISISKQQLRYELALDRLNLDDYLPPAAGSSAGTGTTPGKDTETNSGDDVAAATGDEKIELPLDLIRQLDIDGDLRVAALTASQYEISQLHVHTSAQKAVVSLDPITMQLLEGQLSSAITMQAVKAIPAYAIRLDAKQLQAGPVANPLLEGVMGDEPVTMQGAVDLAMNVKTTGETVNQLKQAAAGTITLDMSETRVDGFDPEYYMRSSVASYVDSSGSGLAQTIMGEYQPRKVTVFDRIHSTVKLAGGKASTRDFIMDSKRVQVTAEGYADIMQNRMDVTSSVRLPRNKTAMEKLLDEPVYVRVYGPFEALQYKIDSDRLKKSTTDVLEREAKAKLEAEKQRLKAKADEEKRRAEEKAEQELQKKKDELEEKLKNKLKGLF